MNCLIRSDFNNHRFNYNEFQYTPLKPIKATVKLTVPKFKFTYTISDVNISSNISSTIIIDDFDSEWLEIHQDIFTFSRKSLNSIFLNVGYIKNYTSIQKLVYSINDEDSNVSLGAGLKIQYCLLPYKYVSLYIEKEGQPKTLCAEVDSLGKITKETQLEAMSVVYKDTVYIEFTNLIGNLVDSNAYIDFRDENGKFIQIQEFSLLLVSNTPV